MSQAQRSARALAAIGVLDAQPWVKITDDNLGMLLAAAAGLPLPLEKGEDGEDLDREIWLQAMIDTLLLLGVQGRG